MGIFDRLFGKKVTLSESKKKLTESKKGNKESPVKDGQKYFDDGIVKWKFNNKTFKTEVSYQNSNGGMTHRFELKNNKLDGIVEIYDMNTFGLLSTINYQNGVKNGKKTYNHEWLPYKEEIYSNNILIEEYYIFPDGNKLEFSKFKELMRTSEMESHLNDFKKLKMIDPLNNYIESSINDLINFYKDSII